MNQGTHSLTADSTISESSDWKNTKWADLWNEYVKAPNVNFRRFRDIYTNEDFTNYSSQVCLLHFKYVVYKMSLKTEGYLGL